MDENTDGTESVPRLRLSVDNFSHENDGFGSGSQPQSLTMDDKRRQYNYQQPQAPDFRETVKSKVKEKSHFSKRGIKKAIVHRIPILGWLLHYNIRQDLLGDAISGFTVAVMHIPQGMAYAMMANLDPICGIYMAFYPVMIYSIFGSSRHCSLGTFAVVCIMTGKVVSELATIPGDPALNSTLLAENITGANNTEIYTSTEVACILSFAVGAWMILFALLQLGSLSVFLSDMLVSGFTTGAACHVFTSQIKHIFGLSITSYTGPFKVILTWKDIILALPESNPAAVIISAICLFVLIINNELIKPRVAKKTKLPIPIELIVVVLGTLISSWVDLNDNFNVIIVGEIPTGLPPVKFPIFSLFGQVVVDGFIIAIVAFTISYSMARIFGKKGDYQVDATQELTAIGLGNMMGSLSASGPIAASLSRSLIQYNVGGKTQLTSLISCAILLLVLLFIGPFFETLPNCVLASIILVALKGMFLQFDDFFTMLKISKPDALLWVATFLGVVIIDIDYGLLIGVICSIILLLVRNQSPSAEVLGKVPNTDIYLEKDKYPSVEELPGVVICNISGSLHFANQESLRNSIVEAVKLDPRKIKKTKKKQGKLDSKASNDKEIIIKKDMESSDSARSDSSYSQDIVEDGINITSHKQMNGKSSKVKAWEKDSPLDQYTLNQNGKVIPSIDKQLSQLSSINLRIEETIPKFMIMSLSGVSQMDVSACKNLKVLQAEFEEVEILISFTNTTETVFESITRSGVLSSMPNTLFFQDVSDAVAALLKDPKTIEDGKK